MFSPGDRVRLLSHTFGAYVLAAVIGITPNGPQLCHIWDIHHAVATRFQPRTPLPLFEQLVEHTPCLSCHDNVQHFKVCYSSTQKFFTFLFDP